MILCVDYMNKRRRMKSLLFRAVMSGGGVLSRFIRLFDKITETNLFRKKYAHFTIHPFT